jgi:hypothetical protein
MQKIKSLPLGMAILIVASCASPGAHTAPGQAAPAATVTMQTTQPSTPAPDAQVSALYKEADGKQNPLFQTGDRALVDKYFVKSTADLIWKDLVDSKGEAGALGADPLYDAQDTDIKNFSVHAPEIKDGRAEVVVSFENSGEQQRITYLLSAAESVWKITDIKYRDGRTLVGVLKGGKADNTRSSNRDSSFEGRYRVGDRECTVKAIKMAFDVKCAKGKGTTTFFFDSEASGDKFVYASEKTAAGVDKFVFDDDSFEKGKFVSADGKESTVTKIK